MTAMARFIMLLCKEMEVITVTDNIYTMFGINMADILGRILSDFIHPCDINILQSDFTDQENQRQLCLRVKNLLQDNGRVIGIMQAGYNVSRLGRKIVCITCIVSVHCILQD